MATAELIKELRERTGAGLMDCKKALMENNNDIEKSIVYLREKGLAKAAKKAGRDTSQGRICSYIHAGGKIGVLLQLGCETDFVAKNEEFEELGNILCMQIAAMSPLYISEEDIPQEVLDTETKIIKTQLENEGKKPEQIEKIIPGKLKKYYSEVCLLHQVYFRDENKTISDVIQESIAKFGENISIIKFVRFQIG